MKATVGFEAMFASTTENSQGNFFALDPRKCSIIRTLQSFQDDSIHSKILVAKSFANGPGTLFGAGPGFGAGRIGRGAHDL